MQPTLEILTKLRWRIERINANATRMILNNNTLKNQSQMDMIFGHYYIEENSPKRFLFVRLWDFAEIQKNIARQM